VLAALAFFFPSFAVAVDPPVEVGGGGARRSDCLATFLANANVPQSRPRRVRCTDGDPTCDADGTVDGVCTFEVAVCANSTFDPARCTSNGIDAIDVVHSIDDGTDPDFDPDLQGLQQAIDSTIDPPTAAADLCTATAAIHVRVKGPINGRCHRNRKQVRLFGIPQDDSREDRDRLRLHCDPAPDELGGCDAMTLFSGTFDRIEKQVFSQSCAVGTCHDSESHTGQLILESGSAYGNLVGVGPQNGAAQGLGWLRIDPGSSANSFLYHKITDDLDLSDSLGLRMPRPPGRRKLHSELQELIRLWIDNGAPETGWVPGTF
jgi:hypothetical protein